MKKLILLITILSALIITGCTTTTVTSVVESDPLTNEQIKLLKLTGNKAFMYNIKNLPKDEAYELNVVYEVYEKGEKITEDIIVGAGYDQSVDKIKNVSIGLNIADDKIRCIMDDGAIYSEIDIKEDIDNMSYQYLEGDVKMNIGDEIYLFHGLKGGESMSFRNLTKVTKEDIDMYMKEHDTNVFIKLVCK